MATVAGIVSQIASCSAFFDSQANLMDVTSVENNRRSMSSSIVSQIERMALDVAGGTAITQSIAASTFSAEYKNIMAAAVNNRVAAGPGLAHGGHNKVQRVKTLHMYLTAADWEVFESDMPLISKVARLCQRFERLGIMHPSEGTTKQATSLIASVACPNATCGMLFNIVQDIKRTITAIRTSNGQHSGLMDYPMLPQSMPQAIYDKAYTGTDTPITKVIDNYNAVWAKIPMRSTNRGITSTVQVQPAPMDAVQQLLQHLSNASRRGQGSSEIPGLVFNRRIGSESWARLQPGDFGPESPTPRLALGDATPAVSPQVSPPVAGALGPMPPLADANGVAPGGATAAVDDDADAVAQMERAAAVRSASKPITKKPCLKKPAADGTPPPIAKKSKVMKKPAAAEPPPAKKKPAAAGPSPPPPSGHPRRAALILGCSKCRLSKHGCGQCRDPAFAGRRGVA